MIRDHSNSYMEYLKAQPGFNKDEPAAEKKTYSFYSAQEDRIVTVTETGERIKND